MDQSFSVTNKIVYDSSKYFNPYVLRNKALKEELVISLMHITKNRGFKNLFDSEKGEDKSEMKSDHKLKKDDDYGKPIIDARNLIGYDPQNKEV